MVKYLNNKIFQQKIDNQWVLLFELEANLQFFLFNILLNNENFVKFNKK